VKILIIETYYPAFLRSFYSDRPGLERRPYPEQWRALMDRCFGVADFYSTNLARLGCEAAEVVANAKPLQHAWAREHGLTIGHRLALRRGPGGIPVPWVSRSWIYPVLRAQVQALRPDIVHVQDPAGTDPAFLREIRPHARRITGQIASPYPSRADFRGYDLLLSSMPHLVETFRKAGIRSELFHLGFEHTVLRRLGPAAPRDVVFVGGLSRLHEERIRFFEALARRRSIEWFGYGREQLAPGSPLRACYRGPAWGLAMYEALAGARIALNHHIDLAGRYANNMRLYEATGVGALLLTDWKENLPRLYEPGKEVAAYRSVEECIDLMEHYLAREGERATVARAGQARTLRDHTYEQRMREFIELARPLL
jgi:spore maturation protein CgeB